jgi:Endonuclease-reverse transcriptase
VIALQETKFNFNFVPNYKGYKSYYKNENGGGNSKWGVLTLVRETLKSREIVLNTRFNAIAVELSFPKKFVICNIYWSGNEKKSFADFDNLISQLGENYLILGDFNAHNPIWGSSMINARGKLIEKIINERELLIKNDGRLN